MRGFEPLTPCLSSRGYDGQTSLKIKWLVDVAGIEPATPCLQSRLKFNLL